jgi:DHA1 family bicyclomycin/chloramphenicol resistance-like MFS transporter
MLMGRVLQGFGSASARVVTIALIRDRFEGSEMGRVMSLILAVFIMVPALAPSIGQGILYVADWRAIFWFIFAMGIFGGLWLNIRQPETLTLENRRSFTFAIIYSGILETIKNPISRTYAIISGIIFGAFLGYLSSAQQILQIQYELRDSFPLYFGGLALVIGVSSITNSKLVMRFRMEVLCQTALITVTVTSFFFLMYVNYLPADPDLTILMIFLLIVFFNVGILFGNLNTLAVQPLGHIAGIGTSIVGSVQTMFSVALGGVIGQLYNGTVIPLISGFFACGLLSLFVFMKLQHQIKKQNLSSNDK